MLDYKQRPSCDFNASHGTRLYLGVPANPPLLKKFETLTNVVESIEQFCKTRKKPKTPVMMVMTATGGYETILVRELAKHNICAAVVNPR